MKFDSLPSEARFQVERVLSGKLRIAPEYANLRALYILVTTHRMPESEARFYLAMARGELPRRSFQTGRWSA
jgi:hypothetical protein